MLRSSKKMRALVELNVLTIGDDLGFLAQTVFTVLVIGPRLQLLLPRMGHRIGERVQA